MNQMFKGLAETKAAYELEQKELVDTLAKDLAAMQQKVMHLINITPSGEIRNIMTEVNINVSYAILKTDNLKRRMERSTNAR